MNGKRLRIEICGGIASGKTTLARALERLAETTVYEKYMANPFYEAFYRNPERYSFEAEITFLLQHYFALKDATDESTLVVSDFSIAQDIAYAEVNLRSGRRAAFRGVSEQVLAELKPPDVLLHLVCDAKEELYRIRQRSRAAEIGIEVGYLDSVNEAVAEQVKLFAQESRVITVDSENIDFAHNVLARQEIIDMIAAEIDIF